MSRKTLKNWDLEYRMQAQRVNLTKLVGFPEDWQSKKISEISKSLIGGGTPSTTVQEYWNGEIPWIRSAWIKGRYIISGERYITKLGLEASSSNLVPLNNLIVATRVSIGNVAINKIDVAINQDLTGIIVDNSKVDVEFLYWVFFYFQSIFKSLVQGSTIKGLTREDLKNIEIPVPAIREQQKIASILSKIDELIQKTNQIIKKLHSLKKGLMHRLLMNGIRHNSFKKFIIGPQYLQVDIPSHWQSSNLGNLLIQSISYGVLVPDEDPNGVPMIRSGGIDSIGGIENNILYISRTLEERYKKTRLLGGEILMALVGATIGRLTIAPNNCKGYNVSRALAVIRFQVDYVPEFYAYLFQTPIFQKKIRIMTTGSAQPVINLEELSKFKVPVPKKCEQLEIVSILSKLDEGVQKNCDYHLCLLRLKSGLLQKLLTGKIRAKI